MLFVISGPSGSGKTTLTKKLVSEVKNLRFVTSYTTRAIRKEEKDGVDYAFVSEDKFHQMVKENKFLEWAQVHGNFYGTPYEAIKESDSSKVDLLLDINIEGALKIKDAVENGIYIFLKPPSLEILKQRLLERKDIPEPEIEKRMEVVRKEIEKSNKYDYIIVNSELEYSFNNLVDIIKNEREKKYR
jgi:guanylate kinase